MEDSHKSWAKDSLWAGSYKHRGLGVFSYRPQLVMLDWKRHGLELVLPFTIDNKLTALAVWARHANSPTFRYIGRLWKYLQAHKTRIEHHSMIFCGDFNSNACWDVWDRWWNHSDVVRELSSIGLESVHHYRTGETQGNRRRFCQTFIQSNQTEQKNGPTTLSFSPQPFRRKRARCRVSI